MNEPRKVVAANDPVYASGVSIKFSEEEFCFFFTSGEKVYRLVFSPKHTKRLLMVLNKYVAEYESKFGELKTQLANQPLLSPLSADDIGGKSSGGKKK